MTPSLLVALGAGLVSFLSPCVLPLVPAYLAVLAGGTERATRRTAVRRALFFILGFPDLRALGFAAKNDRVTEANGLIDTSPRLC